MSHSREKDSQEVRLARIRSQDKARIVDAVASGVKLAIKGGTLALLGMFARDSVRALAGEDTKVWVAALLQVPNLEISISWSLTVTTSVAWAFERRARKRHVKESSKHIRRFEQGVDPGRSSSRLTAVGETRKEDHD